MDNIVVWTKNPCFGQIIPLRAVLKKNLELPNIFQVVKFFIIDEFAKYDDQGVYTTLFQGEIWKNISKSLCEKTVIPLYLYYDDFEVNNPLSSSVGIHKIEGLYFSIA